MGVFCFGPYPQSLLSQKEQPLRYATAGRRQCIWPMGRTHNDLSGNGCLPVAISCGFL